VAIRCPHCQQDVAVKSLKPGLYQPKCPKCGLPFEVLVELRVQVRKPGQQAAAAPATSSGDDATLVHAAPATVGAAASESWDLDTYAAPLGAAPSGASAASDGATRQASSVPAAHDATGEWTAAGPTRGAADPTRGGGDSQAHTGAATLPADAPRKLGGYQIVKELGRGGMGSVYLARQLSLDRDVAVKVMQPRWANDPVFVARFTREAYAAAQLVHHNVVQIYDIGSERDINYFSMEFVRGRSLADLVRGQGKLDAEEAVGYVLQAARGLKFAHDQGMIHRDIKPDNLLLSDHGVVKVADLGLVKTPGAVDEAPARRSADEAPAAGSKLSAIADVTQANVAIGTPAYMSPEQGTNAATVDHRADIYSLGCTLYVLVTGRPPFQGTTVMEVLTKHRSEPVLRPDAIVKRVPKELADIIVKMVAKRPEDRYQDLDEVVKALEGFLGMQSGPFTPREEHVETLEQCVREFNAAPAARVRKLALAAFVGGCALLTLMLAPFSPLLAGGMLGLALLTAAAYFVLDGLRGRGYVFSKVREFVVGASWGEWLTWGMAALLGAAVLVLLNWGWIWLGACLAAAGLAAAMHVAVDRRLADQRAAVHERAEQMLKAMRLHGLGEEALRQFVARYGGDRWEEFFESLFGFEAKLAARQWLIGERGRSRERHRAWREPLVAWIDARQRARRQARERRHLQRVEQRGLQSTGLPAAEARQRAEAAADIMVTQAVEMRQTVADPRTADAGQKRDRIKRMLEATEQAGRKRAERRPLGHIVAGPLNLALGPRMRFLAGAVLLGGCLWWIHQNGFLAGVAETAAPGVQSVVANVKKLGLMERIAEAKPLSVPLLPAALAALLGSIPAGIAGVILLASSLFRGWKMAAFALPAAGIALFGDRLGIPAIGPIAAPYVACAIGAGLAVVGWFLGRTRA